MVKHPNRPMTDKEFARMKRQYEALQRLAKYMPPDLAQEIRSMPVDFDAMEAERAELARLEAVAAAAEKEADKAERELHRLTLGIEKEIIRQYGEDSEIARTLGIKLTSNGRIMRIRPKKDGGK